MNCSSEIELYVSTILKFKYYGTQCNVKKIKADDCLIISVYNFNTSYFYQTFFEKCLIKVGLKVFLALTSSTDNTMDHLPISCS